MNAFAPLFYEFVRSVNPASRLRFAPTPSGFLHLGNALNFTLNWLAANYCAVQNGHSVAAKIQLRIDDLDNDRKRPEYLDDIFESLHWLQLDWEAPPVFQSEHTERYTAVLAQLRAKNLLFACRKSRRDLEPFGGQYPAEFRQQNLSLDDPEVAWRLKTPPDFPLPDVVLRRRDGIPAYQVASLSDDLHFGITHVIRGLDLEGSTQVQCYLAEQLSADKFLKINFLHHPLLLDESGEKLSKSAGSTALKTLREAGQGPEKVFQILGKWLDLPGDSAQSLQESLHRKLA